MFAIKQSIFYLVIDREKFLKSVNYFMSNYRTKLKIGYCSK